MLALASGFMAGCTDNIPEMTINDVTEDYVKGFVEAFGVPQQGHDFSMARSAGLRVKSSRSTHITVTAKIDNVEYLFGDLYIKPGITTVPATIPSDVTELTVKSGPRSVYTVSADGLLDLDNPPVDSRAETSRAGEGFSVSYVNEIGDPLILVQDANWVKRELINHLSGGAEKYQYGLEKINGYSLYVLYDESLLTVTKSCTITYDVFPIYWKKNASGHKDYKLSLFDVEDPELNLVTLDFGGDETKPFPGLGYSPKVLSHTQFSVLNESAVFDDGTFDEAFSTDYTQGTIISKGLRLTIDGSYKGLLGMAVTCNDGTEVSTSCPYINGQIWDGNYYRTTLDNLCDVYGSSTRIYPEMCLFELYNKNEPLEFGAACRQASNNANRGLEFSRIFGFSSIPTKPDDPTSRDCTEVAFLFINRDPDYKYQIVEPLIEERVEPYYWTVTAEDLGSTADWDFNDVVFRFTDVVKSLPSVNTSSIMPAYNNMFTYAPYSTPNDAENVRVIEVEPLAAGGTLPIYITYTGKVIAAPDVPASGDISYYEANKTIRDHLATLPSVDGTYLVGKEVHRWLGATTYTSQINTGAKREVEPGEKVTFAIPLDAKPSDGKFSLDLTSHQVGNSTAMGFAVLVDTENNLQKDAMSEGCGVELLSGYTFGEGTFIHGGIDDSNGSVAPQLLILKGDWEWPQEYIRIDQAYPEFSDWVASKNDTGWQNNNESELVTKK